MTYKYNTTTRRSYNSKFGSNSTLQIRFVKWELSSLINIYLCYFATDVTLLNIINWLGILIYLVFFGVKSSILKKKKRDPTNQQFDYEASETKLMHKWYWSSYKSRVGVACMHACTCFTSGGKWLCFLSLMPMFGQPSYISRTSSRIHFVWSLLVRQPIVVIANS
jgi:hypothetical protein